jgi:hypothetical protein
MITFGNNAVLYEYFNVRPELYRSLGRLQIQCAELILARLSPCSYRDG